MFIYRLDDEREFLSSSSMAWGQDVQTDRSGRQQVNVRRFSDHLARAGTVLGHIKNTKPLPERRQGHLDARPASAPIAIDEAECVLGRERFLCYHAHVLPDHSAGHAPSRSGLGSGVSRLRRHEVLQHRPGLQPARRRLHDQGIALTQPLGAEGHSHRHALPRSYRRLRWRAIRRHNRVGTRSVRFQDYGVEGSPFVCIVLYRTHCRSTPLPRAATIRPVITSRAYSALPQRHSRTCLNQPFTCRGCGGSRLLCQHGRCGRRHGIRSAHWSRKTGSRSSAALPPRCGRSRFPACRR